MEAQRHEWTSTHAQLWTSFRRVQEGRSLSEQRGDGSMSGEMRENSASDQQLMPYRWIASSMLNEVTTRVRLDEPVFSDELEGRILGLIDDGRTDDTVRDLLATIIHLRNRVERTNATAIYRQESIMGAVHEALFHLTGEKPKASGATKTETESTEALAEIENHLFAVLVEIEKCKKMIFTLAQNLDVDKALSSSSSMREMLDLTCSAFSSKIGVLAPNFVENNHTKVLKQVMDILGAPPGVDPSQAPDLALRLVKNLEFVKQENDVNSALLLQYEKTVLDNFASCGVVSPPTVERVREALLSSADDPSPSLTDLWISDHLRSLASTMFEVGRSCQLNILPTRILEGPTDASAGAVLEYMRTLLSAARELLNTLARDMVEAKTLLLRMSYKLDEGGSEGKGSPQFGFTNEVTFMQVLHGFGRLVDHQCEQHISGVSGKELHEKSLDMMMRIIRCLPDEHRMRSAELARDLDALVDYVEAMVKHLVASSRDVVERDAIVRQIEELNVHVARLMDIIQGSKPQILDPTALSTLVDTARQLRLWVMEKSQICTLPEEGVVQQCLHELAQLLPTGVTPSSSVGAAQIVPPVNNLPEMVQLLKRRQEQWVQEQQRHQLSGAQSRLEKARVEEVVRERGQQLIKITKDILLGTGSSGDMEVALTALSAEFLGEPVVVNRGGGIQGNGGAASSTTLIFDDLEERLRLVKVRHHRLMQSYAANKVRLDNLIQSNTAHGKRWSRICGAVGAICHAVGLDHTVTLLERDAKTAVVPSSSTINTSNTTSAATVTATSKHMLRSEQHKNHTVQPVTDANLLETLKLVEESLKDDDALRDRAAQKSEILRLLEEKKRWMEEMEVFHRAMHVMQLRLAEAGRRVKRSLFLLGTDESAEDDVVEKIMMEHLNSAEEGGGKGGSAGTFDGSSRRTRQEGEYEANEELLAVLLQKFGRWATRLQETTEDHLYTQQKLVKYFAPVHRLFCASHDTTQQQQQQQQQQGTTNENLIDIDTTLMGFADGILPVLNRAIAAATSFVEDDKDNTGNTRSMALSLLLQNAPTDHVLPVDHRLVRLYESVGRLRTMVSGLLSVRYLSIPSASRRRSGGVADELTFDDALGGNYIELDIGKVRDCNNSRNNNTKVCNDKGDGSNVLSLNEDALFHAVESNIMSVYQTLGKFSKNYKLAAILLQKDMDMVQQFISVMLEPYIQLDVERAFSQNPEVLHEMYMLLSERATRQRGCYFFSRVGGEGPCVWAAALEQLSMGFVGILEKLRKRTQAAAELRELADDVVDLCAMYVNWVDMSGSALLLSHPLPQDVLEACVREDEDEDEVVVVEEVGLQNHHHHRQQQQQQQQQRDEMVTKPPLPPSHKRRKISHFLRDEVVLKVISHMFQIAQEVASGENIEKGSGNTQQLDAQVQQMGEQIQLLRETAAVAEQRANAAFEDCQRMKEGRDKALSEAAVSRAELRRWKRQHDSSEEHGLPPPSSILSSTSSFPRHQQDEGMAVGEADRKEIVPATTAQLHSFPQPPAEVERSPDGNRENKDALLLVAQSMKELTEELRGVCQRVILTPSQAATGTEHQTTTGPKALRSRGGDSLWRGSGLVRSPKERQGIPAVRGSLSPRSSSSSVPPTTGGVSSRCSPPELDMQPKGRPKVQQECVPIPCASVSVIPATQTYSSLARGQTCSATSPLRRGCIPHHQPCNHRGNFFNECEVCCRRHSSSKSKMGMLDPAAAASSALLFGTAHSSSHLRSRTPQKQFSNHSSRTWTDALKTPRCLQGRAEMDITRGTNHHQQSRHVHGLQRPQQTRVAEAFAKIVSPRFPETTGVAGTSSEAKKHSYSIVNHGNCYDHHGRANASPHVSSLRSPSTSTVLSPESVLTSTENAADHQQMWCRSHHHHHHHHHHQQQQQQHDQPNQWSVERREGQRRTASASGVFREAHCGDTSGVAFSASPKEFGQNTANRGSASFSHGETRRRRQEQKQHQGRRSARTSTRLKESLQRDNPRSDAVQKLADIVSKTKISGREEL